MNAGKSEAPDEFERLRDGMERPVYDRRPSPKLEPDARHEVDDLLPDLGDKPHTGRDGDCHGKTLLASDSSTSRLRYAIGRIGARLIARVEAIVMALPENARTGRGGFRWGDLACWLIFGATAAYFVGRSVLGR